MNIKRFVNNYVECNNFEIKILNDKVEVYYHDKVEHFSNENIVILGNGKKYKIEGSNMVIEKMFKEMVTITGAINKIIIGNKNE